MLIDPRFLIHVTPCGTQDTLMTLVVPRIFSRVTPYDVARNFIIHSVLTWPNAAPYLALTRHDSSLLGSLWLLRWLLTWFSLGCCFDFYVAL